MSDEFAIWVVVCIAREHWFAKLRQAGSSSNMRTLEKIEQEVKQLSKAEQSALAQTLASLLANGDTAEGDARRARLQAFFAEWDSTHSVTVGEKPTRERTYAGNTRLH